MVRSEGAAVGLLIVRMNSSQSSLTAFALGEPCPVLRSLVQSRCERLFALAVLGEIIADVKRVACLENVASLVSCHAPIMSENAIVCNGTLVLLLVSCLFSTRRGGRVVDGSGLKNRCTVHLHICKLLETRNYRSRLRRYRRGL